MNNPFPTLNLPPFNANIRLEGKNVRIFDTLRQRFVALTPEEWVRQHFVNMLLTNYGFSSSLTANEVSLSLNGMSRRCDTVVYDKQLRPRMIVEYKRPSVEITQRVFDQICSYNMVMHVDYLVVSNGMHHFACRMDYERQTYEFLKEIPNAETVLGNE